ncbi:MAG: 50S ribosomal protein L18 [Xylanivirga thermophila]|uniref:50S ribosomal protein L18 n=1 Tax=Xylanivirga thermophila TaxID=2496273 RepID=UPI00101DCA47|nr:50S ribosomal protein L18 [Xylanivirga thermophila]
MILKTSKNEARQKRHARVRQKLSGTAERPRFNVFKSDKHIYVQIIDDVTGRTLVSASTIDPELKGKIADKTKTEAATLVGQLAAQRALDKQISKVVFDRGGYIYHGRIKAVADGARQAGLEF